MQWWANEGALRACQTYVSKEAKVINTTDFYKTHTTVLNGTVYNNSFDYIEKKDILVFYKSADLVYNNIKQILDVDYTLEKVDGKFNVTILDTVDTRHYRTNDARWAGGSLEVVRATDLLQLLHLEYGIPIPVTALETELDKITAILQEMHGKYDGTKSYSKVHTLHGETEAASVNDTLVITDGRYTEAHIEDNQLRIDVVNAGYINDIQCNNPLMLPVGTPVYIDIDNNAVAAIARSMAELATGMLITPTVVRQCGKLPDGIEPVWQTGSIVYEGDVFYLSELEAGTCVPRIAPDTFPLVLGQYRQSRTLIDTYLSGSIAGGGNVIGIVNPGSVSEFTCVDNTGKQLVKSGLTLPDYQSLGIKIRDGIAYREVRSEFGLIRAHTLLPVFAQVEVVDEVTLQKMAWGDIHIRWGTALPEWMYSFWAEYPSLGFTLSPNRQPLIARRIEGGMTSYCLVYNLSDSDITVNTGTLDFFGNLQFHVKP